MNVKENKKRKLCFTVDLEDHREIKDYNTARYEKNTESIICWLEENSIKSTFFIVGNLVKRIAENGHDISFHSYKHTPLTIERIEDFIQETSYGKKLLEDLIGKQIIGFRAPCFSLTKKTVWAIDILSSMGFKYSSSTIPTNRGKYCFPEIPSEPFKWHTGLIEYPMVLGNFLGIQFPSIGGLYLRIYPASFATHTLNKKGLAWTHIHPQDVDPDEPFTRVENLSNFQSYLYSLNRKRLFKKLDYLKKNFYLVNMESDFKYLDITTLKEINFDNV